MECRSAIVNHAPFHMAAAGNIANCPTKICNVLFIEDDVDDIFLFQRAFAQSRIPCQVHVVQTVAEGIAYLSGRDQFADRQKFPLPDLIITDLGFRGDDGIQFLNWLHYESDCRNIPLVCMTGSSDPEKLAQARTFGARCIPKTAVYEDVVELIRTLLPQAQ